VFGSVLHGNDKDGSDLDLLVDALPGTGLSLFKMQGELTDQLGVEVEVLTPECLHRLFRAGQIWWWMIAPSYFTITASTT
jgi:uncharacterized protein